MMMILVRKPVLLEAYALQQTPGGDLKRYAREFRICLKAEQCLRNPLLG